MTNIYILIGPPLSGKETQGDLLELSLGGIPRFSMGHLIREAKEHDNAFKAAYADYSMKGMHLPNEIKFPLMVEKMNSAMGTGFILDNFPGTSEDIEYLERYLVGKDVKIAAVISLSVSEDEMQKRFEIAKEKRGRADDTIENIHDRREIQDRDRVSVLDHYRSLNLLHEINGEGTIEEVHDKIMNSIRKGNI